MRGEVVSEYGFIFGFIVLATGLSIVIYLLSYLLVPKVYDVEKLSAYECGFDPFADTRGVFDVRFYFGVYPFYCIRSRGNLPVPLDRFSLRVGSF